MAKSKEAWRDRKVITKSKQIEKREVFDIPLSELANNLVLWQQEFGPTVTISEEWDGYEDYHLELQWQVEETDEEWQQRVAEVEAEKRRLVEEARKREAESVQRQKDEEELRRLAAKLGKRLI